MKQPNAFNLIKLEDFVSTNMVLLIFPEIASVCILSAFFGKVGIKVKLKSFASNASDWDAFVPKTFNWLLIWVSLPLANYLSSKSL